MSARPEEKPLTIVVTLIVLALVVAFILSQYFYLNGVIDETQEIVIGGSLALILMLVIVLYVTMLTRWDNSTATEFEHLVEERERDEGRD
ncbi:MAG: hypothetical protein MJZ38_05850 [archaeon]|nr:hypothetical protein [archaeon]